MRFQYEHVRLANFSWKDLAARALLDFAVEHSGPMSKRVTAALLGVPLSLATLWGAYSLSFNFYVEYLWMPLDKYGVRTPFTDFHRFSAPAFVACVPALTLSLTRFGGSHLPSRRAYKGKTR